MVPVRFVSNVVVFLFFSLYLSERICLCPGHQHQWCFFTVRSCRGSRVMAALRSTRGFDLDETATQAFTRGKKFTRGTFDSCLLDSSFLHRDEWRRCKWCLDAKVETNISICVYLLFFCSCWECSRITLPEVNLHWSSIADIDILNTAFIHAFLIQIVCIIHVLYIYVREVKWFVYSARLLLLGRSLLLSKQSENQTLWFKNIKTDLPGNILNWSFVSLWGKHLPGEADLLCCQRTTPTGLLKVVNITKYSLRSLVPICLFVVYDWQSRSACRFYFTRLALMSHIDWNCVNGNCESKINPMESILEKDTMVLWGDISGVWTKKQI